MPKIAKKKTETKSTPKETKVEKNGQADKKKSAPKREVIYPDIKFKLFSKDDALTDDQAKKFLGWTEVPKGADYDFQDENEKYVKLVHNIGNRKFEMAVCRVYIQCVLEGRWELNLEDMIIGRTGLVISAQHRMVALILACQIWEKTPEDWPVWKTRPVMQCVIAFGADESDRVVNTIDTGRPRSFADVIYRSAYFAGMDNQTRDKLAKYVADAVALVQQRTKARDDAFSPNRPHSEGLEFLDNHLTLLKCVKHIHEENGKKGTIRYYLSPGYAAGLMYLMCAGKTDKTKYEESDVREEKNLTITKESYGAVADFFVLLAQGAKELQEVKECVNKVKEAAGRLTRDEGIGFLVKAWLLFSDGKPVKRDSISLTWNIDPDTGEKHLVEFPSVGGIDYGNPDFEPDADDDESNDPTEGEIEQRAEQVRDEKLNGKKKNGKKKETAAKEGDVVYVEEDGGVWSGVITEIYDGPHGKVAKVRDKSKKVFDAPLSNCHLTNPQTVA